MRGTLQFKRVIFTFLILCLTCYAYTQTTIQLTVTQPSVLESDAGADTFIYQGDTIQIGGSPSATGGTSPYLYTWTPNTKMSDPTIPDPIVFPGSTITYTLKVTDDNSCTSSSTVKIKVSGLSIAEGANIRVNIYPNPNKGNFYVHVEGHSNDNMILEVLNNLGQVVYKENVERLNGLYESKINISECSEGVYMLRLSGDNTNIFQRLIFN